MLVALRSIGVTVRSDLEGPFRAMADGGLFLAPHGLRLAHITSDVAMLQPGKYIVWHESHFVSVFIDSAIIVVDGENSFSFDAASS